MVSAKQASSNLPLGVSGTTQTRLRDVFGRRRNDSLSKLPDTRRRSIARDIFCRYLFTVEI